MDLSTKTPHDLTNQISTFLDEHKIFDITTVDLRGKTSIADTLIIACGRSQKHISMIGHSLQDHLKKNGMKWVLIEGFPHSEWILIDAGYVIVHLFCPHNRADYGLEKMWADGGPVPD